MLNKNHPLHNRTLHINGTFKETEKPDIYEIKPDIKNVFQQKTASRISKLRKAFPGQMIFGRSDVMNTIAIKSARTSDLLKKLANMKSLNL